MHYRTPGKMCPSSESPNTLANASADFFTNKITKIRDANKAFVKKISNERTERKPTLHVTFPKMVHCS